MNEAEYLGDGLGDGLYATFDGPVLVLTTGSGSNRQTVYLDPSVLESLLKFITTTKAEEKND